MFIKGLGLSQNLRVSSVVKHPVVTDQVTRGGGTMDMDSSCYALYNTVFVYDTPLYCCYALYNTVFMYNTPLYWCYVSYNMLYSVLS